MTVAILFSRPGAPVCEPSPKPLTVTCSECGGSGRNIRSRYGGNDPDTWDAGPCENDCEDGLVTIHCDGWRCDEPAVEMIEGSPYCETCAQEWRTDNGPLGLGA